MKELVEIQAKLKAPKNQRNNFGKYNYRSCEDILEAVKPLCKEQNCTLVLMDKVQQIGERYYVQALATLTNREGVQVQGSGIAREAESKKGMDASQLTGATSSYARKYALNGLFAIDDTKDADATNDHKTQPKATKPNSQIADSIKALQAVKDGEQLKQIWLSLPATMHNADAVKKAKDEMKAKLGL